jgi:copper chaperone CopZ
MRLIVVLLLLLVGEQQFCFAQFNKAKLQATGLTCALCSKAIHAALSTLPFVEKVEADLPTSSFVIQFKKGSFQQLDLLKQAVLDAGFFVGALVMEGKWEKGFSPASTPFLWGDQWYKLLSTPVVKEGAPFKLAVIDKGFVTEKGFKKYVQQYSEEQLATEYFIPETSHPEQKKRLYHLLPLK